MKSKSKINKKKKVAKSRNTHNIKLRSQKVNSLRRIKRSKSKHLSMRLRGTKRKYISSSPSPLSLSPPPSPPPPVAPHVRYQLVDDTDIANLQAELRRIRVFAVDADEDGSLDDDFIDIELPHIMRPTEIRGQYLQIDHRYDMMTKHDLENIYRNLYGRYQSFSNYRIRQRIKYWYREDPLDDIPSPESIVHGSVSWPDSSDYSDYRSHDSTM